MIHLHSGLLEMGMNSQGTAWICKASIIQGYGKITITPFLKNIFSNEIVKIQDKTQYLYSQKAIKDYVANVRKKEKKHQ